jgi:hypothetical protein
MMRNFKFFFTTLIMLGLSACQQSDRLLLCAGNPDTAELAKECPLTEDGQVPGGCIYTENNEGWFTVDKAPVMRPDLLADLSTPEAYQQLRQNYYSVIMAEYCNYEVDDAARLHSPKILKKGGILVAKTCAPYKDLKKIKHKMLEAGFSDVIFGTEAVHFTYEQKKMSPEQIVKDYQQNQVKKQSQNICSDYGKEWYPFVAIK